MSFSEMQPTFDKVRVTKSIAQSAIINIFFETNVWFFHDKCLILLTNIPEICYMYLK